VASTHGVHPVHVAQWKRQALAGLLAVFAARRGWAQAQADAQQAPLASGLARTEFIALLAQRAEAHGFIGQVWSTKRVGAVIQSAFGVSYHPASRTRRRRFIALPSTLWGAGRR
jgi:transposase